MAFVVGSGRRSASTGPWSRANVAIAIVAIGGWAEASSASVAGRYSNQSTLPVPSPWRILELVVEHLAGLDIAVGIIPFAGTLVAAWLWHVAGAGRDVNLLPRSPFGDPW